MASNSANQGRLFVCLAAIGVCTFALPLSNLFSQRTALKVNATSPHFAAASAIMQAKCADCHTPNMVQYPIYFQLPVARDIITEDIAEAQRAFTITPQQLQGEARFTTLELAQIQTVVTEHRMPPFRYTALHWNADLSDSDRVTISSWIKEHAQQ